MNPAPRSVYVLFALAAVAALGAVALLLVAGDPAAPRDGRVLVLALDGLDPDAVAAWSADGGLPHLARMAREGAAGRLRSEEPLLSPVVWTTVATGKPPHLHGIAHFTAVDPATGARRPVTSATRRVKAVWNIVSEAGLEVAVVGWWATWPAEAVRGHVVSDRVGHHFLADGALDGGAAPPHRTHPPALLRRIAPYLRRPDELPAATLARFVELPAERLAPPPTPQAGTDLTDPLSHLRWALATAEGYRDVGLDLWRREAPRLALVYVEAPDTASHLFGAGDGAYARTVEEVYRFADRVVGAFLAAADRRTTVVVLSDHGFALGEAPPPESGVSHRQHRLHGVLRLWGRGVRPGARLRGATLYDVLPTVLALLGLPRADDMPGRVLTEGLSFAPDHSRVASYEGPGGGGPDEAGEDDAVDRALLERLAALGYAAGPPTGDDRRLAAIAYRQGRYEAAERLYRKLVADHPADADLHASLGGVLGKLGRRDEARAALERALALDPDQPQALHNLRLLDE